MDIDQWRLEFFYTIDIKWDALRTDVADRARLGLIFDITPLSRMNDLVNRGKFSLSTWRAFYFLLEILKENSPYAKDLLDKIKVHDEQFYSSN